MNLKIYFPFFSIKTRVKNFYPDPSVRQSRLPLSRIILPIFPKAAVVVTGEYQYTVSETCNAA